MMFSPRVYGSMDELMCSAIWGAHSNTVYDGKDVFGYVGSQMFFCKEIYDEDNGEWFTVADIETEIE
jgi:hypothetical protein